MTRQIKMNAFDMNCVGHIQHGMWTHPRDDSASYNTLDYWVRLAKTAERGLFDGIFLADIVGVYDVYKGSAAPSILNSVQVPVNDPVLVIPAMAHATRHIGFGVTCNLTYEPPYLFARRMSTLDHLTNGRIGWNIVTGYLDSAARGMGFPEQFDHDGRYDRADEFMEVMYKLWEGSWEDDAVLRDRHGRIFANPEKIHRIHHAGPNFQMDAMHLCEPSRQRTPVLYQAGSSSRGRQFAARHAECVFVAGGNKAATRQLVHDLRELAVSYGRAPTDIAVFAGKTVVVGRSTAEAKEKLEEYRRHASIEGALAHMSSSTGIDFSQYGPDEPIRHVQNNSNNSAVDSITRKSSEVWTVRKLTEQMALGSRSAPIVGSAEQVADELQSWVEEADVDGFNLARTVTPESLEDFVTMVVPILQERGVYKTEYTEGTLREKLFGTGRPRLPSSHIGASHRYKPARQPVPAVV
jgi:FMN-dependent oxidoreductase (nitrilotriacetate monooxygenase family)